MRISFAFKWILRTVFFSLAFFWIAVFILQTTEQKPLKAVNEETPDQNRKSFVYTGLRNVSPNEPEIFPLESFIKSTELFQIFTRLSNVFSPVQDLYNDLWYLDHPDNATNKIPPVHHKRTKPHLSVKPRHIIILGSAPSSNSALLSLLQTYIPPAFVHYEPLQSIRRFDPVATPQEIEKALELIQHLILCDRVPQAYLKFGKKFGSQFRHNSHYATLCGQHRPECAHPTVLRTICSFSPIQILSTSQLSVELAARLLVDPALPLLKFVYVTKDPRRILESNRRNFWCQYHSSCNNVTNVCQRIDKDLHYVAILQKKYPDRFIKVSDEDVISQPIPLLQQIRAFANLPLSSTTLNRLAAKYRPLMQETVLSSDLSNRVNDWQTKLSVAELCDIEHKCRNTLKMLQLSLITNGRENCIPNKKL